MGVIVLHLSIVAGRWKYRRGVRAELRQHIDGNIAEFVRSFGRAVTKTPSPDVLSKAIAAEIEFKRLIAGAEAHKVFANKHATGIFDPITPAFATHLIAGLRAEMYAQDEQERFDPKHMAVFERMGQAFAIDIPQLIIPGPSFTQVPIPGPQMRKDFLVHVLAALTKDYGSGTIPSGICDVLHTLCAERGLNVDVSSTAFHALTIEYLHLMIAVHSMAVERHEGRAIVNPPAPPPLSNTALKAPSTISLTGLVGEWWKLAEKGGISHSTYEARERAVRQLVKFLGHDDAIRVTTQDIKRFRDHRILDLGINPLTVKDGDLPSIRGLYNWAIEDDLLTFNPATGVRVKAKDRVDTRSRDPGFSDEEALALLRHTYAHTATERESSHRTASKRWVHWLCAYTGARVGEMVQLRGRDVVEKEGHWIVIITPEAGTVKRGKFREVPLHPYLIEMGFTEFVKASGDGYLFTSPKSLNAADLRSSRRTAKNRITEFVREVIVDKRVAPNHGWRHRFETLSRGRLAIHPAVSDKITGRKFTGESASYGFVSISDMASAIAKFPRIEMDDAPHASKE